MWPRVAWPETRLAVSKKGSRNGTWQGRQGSHFGSSEASLGWIKIPPDPTHPEGRATWEGSSVSGTHNGILGPSGRMAGETAAAAREPWHLWVPS